MFGFTKNALMQNSNEEKTTIIRGGISLGGYVQSAWSKPSEARFVCITCIGPGGWGGAGSTGAGGGGGGAGVTTSVIYPAVVLPQTIYLFAGNALPGEVFGGGQGISAYSSFVSIIADPDVAVASDYLCYADGGNEGGSASGATAGTAGTSIAANSLTNAPRMALGIWQSLLGPAGTAGATSAASATAVTALASSILSGGTGGGYNGTFVAGNITGSGIVPTLTAPTGTSGGAGTAGFWSWKPMCGTGGTGGAPDSATVDKIGGKGGAGAFGCGGGGGGLGSNAGGDGGDGGPGLVFVTWW